MKGVSTRNYRSILPEMAETVGISKSQISRQFAAASEQQLKALCERTFDDKEILVVYIDGIKFGDCRVVVAVGFDSGGYGPSDRKGNLKLLSTRAGQCTKRRWMGCCDRSTPHKAPMSPWAGT